MEKTLAFPDYQALAELRYQVRLFLHFSEKAARKMGLEPQQHQLMLAIKGLPTGMRPTIGTLAERMQIQHHSTVELVNRLSSGGLVRRSRAGEDRRQVLLGLTPKGEKMLRELSMGHKAELQQSRAGTGRGLETGDASHEGPLPPEHPSEIGSRPSVTELTEPIDPWNRSHRHPGRRYRP